MRSGLRQIFLLTIYILLLVFVSRLLECLFWQLHGVSPTQVVDPRVVLGVKQLKALLDARGVGYTGCVEKQELAELVEKSGPVVSSEVALLDSGDDGARARLAAPASHFTGGAHFYEKVEDTKDSVWLVQVAPEGAEPPLDDYSWRLVCAHLAPFAIRAGVFDCRLDRRLCAGKGWHEPLLLLALPRGTRAKDKVLMQIFRSTRTQAIVSWVRQQLSERVEKLPNATSALDWLATFSEEVPKEVVRMIEQPLPSEVFNDPSVEGMGHVRVLLTAQLSRPPLFLAALSVKFAGRIRFGLLSVEKGEEEKTKQELGVPSLPSYILSTPQGFYIYGSGREEHFNFHSMQSFLRAIQPEANDALLFSLVLCQLVIFIKAATKRSFLGMGVIFFTHNLGLLIVWMVIITLARVPFVAGTLSEYFVSAARWMALSKPGLWIRADVQVLTRHSLVLCAATLAFLLAVRRYLLETINVPQPSLRLGLLTRLLPTPSPLQAQELPEQPEPEELLVQRLAVPAIWLTPLVCADYLSSLARWRYRGPIDIRRDVISRELIEEIMRSSKESDLSEDEGPPSHALKAAECPICLEVYSRGCLLCALPCGHTFHEACVMAWLLRDHHSCPSCRWPAYKCKKQ